MQKKFSFKNNRLARTLVISGSILIIVAFVILRYEGFFEMLSAILRILRPIIIGGIIAFALNRPMNFFYIRYRRLFAVIKKTFRKRRHGRSIKIISGKISYALACATTYILALAVLVGIIWFIIPQFSDSINLFADNINSYIENIKEFFDSNKFKIDSIFGQEINVSDILDNIALKIQDQIANFTKYIPEVIKKTMNITSGIIGVVIDFAFGIVFSIYILIDKHKLKENAKILIRIIIKEERYNKFEKIISMAYTTFSNFITGQIIEAIIVGVLCFIGMTIFGFAYAPLISVIVGVTNLIPIVGPIIGTIPGAFILLLVKPIDALWFVIFIIVVQQIDSNIIYPKVVGNSVGLPGLWVLFAITVGGGLAGVTGMILGVPVLSIIYALVSQKLNEAKQKEENN